MRPTIAVDDNNLVHDVTLALDTSGLDEMTAICSGNPADLDLCGRRAAFAVAPRDCGEMWLYCMPHYILFKQAAQKEGWRWYVSH